MNHSILPLLEEIYSHRFSCYNGWKISPESLEDFIGIRKVEKSERNYQSILDVFEKERPLND